MNICHCAESWGEGSSQIKHRGLNLPGDGHLCGSGVGLIGRAGHGESAQVV